MPLPLRRPAKGTPAPLPELTPGQWEARVQAWARAAGYLVFHVRRSRGSAPGFLDVVCLKEGNPGRCVVIECKTGRGKLTPEQTQWLAAWQTVPGVVAMVAYPHDEQAVLDALAGGAA